MQDMETFQTTLPVAEQEALHGTSTPRRSRVSSIFQQKTIKQDDIDADFLKHVAFAALRGSPASSASEPLSGYQHTDQTAIDTAAMSVALSAAVQMSDTNSAPRADMQPADPSEFTVAKIEQSIAEIEAELGWTSDSAAVTAAASTIDVVKSPAAPSSILSSSTSRLHSTSISSTGMSSATTPQGKRLSFLGELVVSEPSRASAHNPSLVFGGAESRSSATTRPVADVAAAVLGAALAEHRNTATADSTVPNNAAGSVPMLEAMPTFDTEDCGLLSDSPSEANLAGQPLQGSMFKLQLTSTEAGMNQSVEGNASKQPLTSLEASPSHSLENSASKRQLTSMHSMQSETMHDGSRRRMIKHNLSDKFTTSSAALASPSTYSSRYATRQLSGKASPASTDGALSPRRSLLASPAASVHGGLPATLQHPGKPGSSKPASQPAKGDDSSRATLTGAAAVLKGHASSMDGAGWHLATGDGLPFSPRGSLVASSGGSRTLRPIASQQEALFDAEGNMLPRSEWHPSQPEPAVQTDSKAGQSGSTASLDPQIEGKQKLPSQAAVDANPGPDSKAASTSAASAAAAGRPAEQKPPAKHSMLSMVMFPCFCLRPRTTSGADDPYPQGSLRQRFAAKEEAAAAGAQPALGSKGVAAPRSALKQKQPNEAVASDMGASDWDLGTAVHRAGEADVADVRLSEKEVQEGGAEGGRSLQGAISLAPKRSGVAVQQPQQATLQQVSEGNAPDMMVSTAAPFVSVGAPIPGNELGLQYESADTPAAESQPQSLTQSRPQSLSHSQEAEAVLASATESASPAAATNAVAAADACGGEVVEGAVAADGQAVGWGNGTGSCQLSALGRTGGSDSSKSGTRRRKEWEGPEVASPAEVSQSLEDLMLQRFPELEPLLLQSSFTNKQAPWRGAKSGHTSHAPSRGHSLGVSREASFTHSSPPRAALPMPTCDSGHAKVRPESRQGCLPTSQLGAPRAVPGLPWEQAQLAATRTQTEPAADLSLYMQSNRQSDVQPEEAAGMRTYSQAGMQSRGQGPAGSSNCPDRQAEQAAVSMDISLPSSMGQQIDVHTTEDNNSSSMSLVEAAALAASSPGAVVHVPTSTMLSQADQIALRYQHQVQFQLQQQALGSSAGLAPTPTARSGSKSPTRRSPTKHRPFHLSDSPWKRDSAQLGQSGKLPSAPPPAVSQATSQAASPRRGRSASKSPVRTARSLKAPASLEKQPTSSKGRSQGASGSSREPERQPERHSSSPAAHGQGGVTGWSNPGVMSFGSFGGIAFSSFTPERPAGSSDMVDEEEHDWADNSGKWGELPAPKSSALPGAPPQPKHSSISLADIACDAADKGAADGRPDPSHSGGPQRGVEPGSMGEGLDAGSRSYLSLLESLAQEGEFGSPGNSDNDSSPTAAQAHVVEQAWQADQLLGPQHPSPQHPSPRGCHEAAAAEQSTQLSEASSTFGDAAVDGLLPHEASQTHTDNVEGRAHHEASDTHTHVSTLSGGLQESDPGAAGDVQEAGRYLAEEEDQPSSLALALAALAATAAQKHAAQTDMQQLQQPDAAESSKPQKADTDPDEQASVSSDSDCDVLAVAAAAAAAAGLSRRQEESPPNAEQAAQLWPLPASAPALAVAAQAGPHEPLWDAEAGSSCLEFQNEVAQHAQQAGVHQRDSASGDYVGPGSSGPSWSAAADGDSSGIDLFRDKQAVNYVGKSARRPKVATPKPKAGGLHGLFSKLRRGGSKEEEELDSSRPASIAAPRPLDSQTEPSAITKSGSWIPKAFSRSQSESGAGSAGSSSPLQGHTRFADQPLLTGQVAQPDRQDRQPLLGPLPSSKAPQETFTALPSLPVPAPITGDPVLAPPASPGAVKGAMTAVMGEVQPGGSRVTFSQASSSLILQQQGTSLHSESGSDSDDDVSAE